MTKEEVLSDLHNSVVSMRKKYVDSLTDSISNLMFAVERGYITVEEYENSHADIDAYFKTKCYAGSNGA